MDRSTALKYATIVIDDAQGVQPISAAKPDARLVGWQCGFEPMFIAVQSFLPGWRMEDEEAEAFVTEYLVEIGWFSGEPTPADFIL